jgi:hypothetical protein
MKPVPSRLGLWTCEHCGTSWTTAGTDDGHRHWPVRSRRPKREPYHVFLKRFGKVKR